MRRVGAAFVEVGMTFAVRSWKEHIPPSPELHLGRV
jgi:hypothetical protein